jgi:hypothetical protein
MYTPAMYKFNLPNVSDGKKDYQHPDRENSSYFGPACDNFSALIIYVSIAGLCHMPDLWKIKNGDRLIADLDPETLHKGTPKSLLRLAKLDPGLNACLGELRRASAGPLEKTRELYDVLKASDPQVRNLSLFLWVCCPHALKKENLLKVARALPQILENLGCGRMAKPIFWKQLLRNSASAAKTRYSRIARFLSGLLLKAKQRLPISVSALREKLERAFRARNYGRRWRNILKWIGIGALACALAAGYSALPARRVPQQTQKPSVPKSAPRENFYAKAPSLPAAAAAPVPAAGATPKPQPAKKPQSPPSRAKAKPPRPLPGKSGQATYVNTGIRTDRARGKGYYERWFDGLYGKGSFRKYLGAYYQNNYKAGKEMPFAKGRIPESSP